MIPNKDFSNVPESDSIVNYIVDRNRKGLYTLCLVTGLPGTGKSSVSIRLAELTSLKLHDENRINEDCIVDSLLGFLKRLRKVKKPGEIIIIEEISVLFGSRRSMAIENVAIGRVLDTCRKLGVILFSNAPIFSSIDSHIRCMAHVLVETQRIYKKAEVVMSKAWKLQTNPHSGKTYRHRFNRHGKEVTLFVTKKPGSELWEKYEKSKDDFLSDLYERLEKRTIKKFEKENKELGMVAKREAKRGLTKREMEAYDLVKRQGMTYEKAGAEMGISHPRIFKLLQQVKEKTQIC
jgi:predicted DNA-binding protein (UPF0251 family)